MTTGTATGKPWYDLGTEHPVFSTNGGAGGSGLPGGDLSPAGGFVAAAFANEDTAMQTHQRALCERRDAR